MFRGPEGQGGPNKNDTLGLGPSEVLATHVASTLALYGTVRSKDQPISSRTDRIVNLTVFIVGDHYELYKSSQVN